MSNFVVVIDTQYDFMMEDGLLYVDGAQSLIVPLTKYLAALDFKETLGVLFTFDTHTREAYEGSPESKLFPLHCELGTKGHKNVLNPHVLSFEYFEMQKPVFDMWAEEASSEHLWVYGGMPTYKNANDFFMERKPNIDVVDIVGVALNFCVKQAADGFIERGFTVRLHPDLTCGIDTGKPGDLDARVLYADEIAQGKVIIA